MSVLADGVWRMAYRVWRVAAEDRAGRIVAPGVPSATSESFPQPRSGGSRNVLVTCTEGADHEPHHI